MMLSLGMVFILFIPGIREPVGKGVGFVFEPLIGFGGNYVVLTIMLAGIIMIGISTVVRTLMTDTMKQAKNQNEMKAFNAELRQARMENNLYKIKKLSEQQSAMMNKSMESSMKMMKTMPLTMLIIIPVISWIWIFLESLDAAHVTIAVPWASAVVLTRSMWILPTWILVYMLITIPFGQLLSRAIRWIKFKKRLEEIDGTQVS